MAFRNGIKSLLDADPDLEIIAEAANGQQVLDILSQNEEVDILLADYKITIMDGPSLLRKLNIHHKNIKILFLSIVDDPVVIAELMRQGASGYPLKHSYNGASGSGHQN